MRTHLLCLLFLLKFDFAFAQISEVKVDDVLILRTIDMFLDSTNILPQDLGVILIDITSVQKVRTIENVSSSPNEDRFKLKAEMYKYTYLFRVSLEKNLVHFDYSIPLNYFFYNGRPIIIYTGLESLVEIGKKSREKFKRRIIKKLPKSGTYFGFPSWLVKIENGEILILAKELI